MKDNNRRRYTEQKLPLGYLNGGYFNTSGVPKSGIKYEYLVTWSEQLADMLKEGKLESNQIRKFFSHAIHGRDALNRGETTIEQALTGIRILISYAEYARKRDVAPQLFVDFIRKNIENIETIADVNAFVIHFESIIGFYKK